MSPFPSFHVIVYLCGASLYVAVYVFSHVTDTISGVHHVRVYILSTVVTVHGTVGAVGTVPYATVVVVLHVVPFACL